MDGAGSVKITRFEAENVKRVRAVELEPAGDGLTVIGGRNGQGKTSVLDAIAWALGGEKRRPTDARRDGAAGDPRMLVELSNGLVVERKGKNSSLKVTDPSGDKAGQKLLDSFIEELALDLPKFMAANDKGKADVLLSVLGIDGQLKEADAEVERLYNQRTVIGQQAKAKRHAADEAPFHPDAPKEEISAAAVIERQQAILARNGENQRKRERLAQIEVDAESWGNKVSALEEEMQLLAERLADAQAKLDAATADLEVARKDAQDLQDESTSEVEAELAGVEEANAKVRANAERARMAAEADELEAQYADLTAAVEDARARRVALLEGADLPLEGLSVEDGALRYMGHAWDCMSSSEQLRVATAIVRRLKPECGFVLVDKLEQLDAQTMAEFGQWASGQGLQVIATRVTANPGECSIVIEDGSAAAVAATDSEGVEAQQDGVFTFPGKE